MSKFKFTVSDVRRRIVGNPVSDNAIMAWREGHQETPFLAPHNVHSLQVAVDHAFTGTYVERFRPTDPHKATQCPCGFRLRTSPHIIHTCPRYNAHRFRANIISTRNPVGPRGGILTNKKQAMGLLTFLQDSRALSRPETGPRAHEPPEPD
ncbi:hypothetical protein EDB85DRAFT_1979097 [Lactarius pseudohatsudake]|nr:hypothetical protein EDB85DRAFT_1979097 [Lactarius pseudohatsudake]